jgi:hypothetical protein
LHPDQPDKGSATGAVDHSDDPAGPDAAIGLVIGVDADRHFGSEHPPPAGIFGETVEAGQGIRRYRGLDPLDRIPVAVIVRRLDQDQVEDCGVALRRSCRGGSDQIERFQLNRGGTENLDRLMNLERSGINEATPIGARAVPRVPSSSISAVKPARPRLALPEPGAAPSPLFSLTEGRADYLDRRHQIRCSAGNDFGV